MSKIRKKLYQTYKPQSSCKDWTIPSGNTFVFRDLIRVMEIVS